LFGIQQPLHAHANTQHNTTSSPPPPILKSFFEQPLFDKNVLSIIFTFVPVIERCTCDNSKCLYIVHSTEFNQQKWIFEINQVLVVNDTSKTKCYAVITNVNLTHIHIHYIGWGKRWNEWISKTSERIDAIRPVKAQFNSIDDYYRRLYNNTHHIVDFEEMSIVREAHKLFLNH
jgi:hypothetical protein